MKILYFFTGIFLLLSCGKDEVELPVYFDGNNYAFFSHTRGDIPNDINEKLIDFEFEKFEMVWLGGDIDINTSGNEETIQIWDEVFDFKNPNTLWALGNHDNTNVNLVNSYTNRPSFYTTNKDNITFFVLDTQVRSSRIKNEQLDLLTSVCDTISESNTLILLSHKLLWLYGNPELEPLIADLPNGVFGPDSCLHCTHPSNFYEDVYPQLVETKKRGIQVICLAGDLGLKSTHFEHETDEGIHFLASGLHFPKSENNILIFGKQKNDDFLSWRQLEL